MSNENANLEKIVATLGTHDARLAGVEDAIGRLVSKLDKFAEAMSHQRASQGPGIREVLTICGLGGGLVSLASAAVTVLVLSLVSPNISELRTVAKNTHVRVERIEEERYREMFEELRDYRRQRLRIPLQEGAKS